MSTAVTINDPPRCAPADHAYTQPTIFESRDGLSRTKHAVSICSKCGHTKKWLVEYR